MPAISLKCCFLLSLTVLPAFVCRQSRGNSKECCHSVLLFDKQKNTAGQKENPSARRRCVCYTKSAYCLGMYAVLGLCQVLGAIQDDAAANSSAVRRVFFKKEAVRLAVIINDDFSVPRHWKCRPRTRPSLRRRTGLRATSWRFFRLWNS